MVAPARLERIGAAFRLHSGASVPCASLTGAEQIYLEWMESRVKEGESYASLLPSVCGPGAFPMRGKGDVDDEVRTRPLFLVAEDLLHRVEHAEAAQAIAGTEAQNDRALLSVTDTAFRLGVSRVAVVKAIQSGRLAAYEMG